ncbi:CGNR zinc finger domain-containing protein [Marmoricola sp. RAF53]|uniref:CGNR zinc finger domain-containing protein n=1 Tax=Marmoricola sp. RAF53 TaxID=3233059 RepID=UPI003F994B10
MADATTAAPLLGEPLPVELMNTIWADREGVHDALATPADAAGWITAVADRPEVGAPELAQWLAGQRGADLASVHRNLRQLRDAARALAARRTDDPRDEVTHPIGTAAAVEIVNALASSAPTWPLLHWSDGGVPEISRASEASPGLVLVADLARSTIALLAGGAGSELRACRAPGCVLYFVRQHPRRAWCSDACGNRARQARHYQRNRPQVTR